MAPKPDVRLRAWAEWFGTVMGLEWENVDEGC